MKKLLLLLMAVVVGVCNLKADYTVEFESTASNATELGTTTKATTFIASDSRQYFETQPVASESKAYYGGASADEKKAIRIGTASAVGNVTLKLSEDAKVQVKKFIVSAKLYTSGDSKAEMKINGKTFTVTSSDFAEYTIDFDGSVISTLVLESTSGGTKTRGMIKSIQVVTGNGGPIETHLGELTGSYKQNAISEDDNIEVFENTTFTFAANNADEISVKVGNNDTVALDVTDGVATWIPSICENQNVTVTAKMNGENPETASLSFYLTVKEKQVISGWSPVTDISELEDGDEVTFYAKEYTGKASGSNVTYPELIMKELNTSNNVITGQEFEYYETEGTLSVDPYILKAIKVDDKWVFINPDGKYILGANKAVNTSETITAACQFAIDVESAGNAVVSFTSGTTTYKLQYNPNISNPVNITTARFAFYSTNQQMVYMLRKPAAVTPPVEKPGEVKMTYSDEHGKFITWNDDEYHLTIEEGVELTFTAEGATHIDVLDCKYNQPYIEGVDGESISWVPTTDIIFNVVATNEGGQSELTPVNLNVLHFDETETTTPNYRVYEDNGKKYLEFTGNYGWLMVQKASYTAYPSEDYWVEANEGVKKHLEDLSTIEDGMVYTFWAKSVSVDRTKSSSMISVNVDKNGIYVEKPTVLAPGEVTLTYSDEHSEFVEIGDEDITIEEGVEFIFTASGATHIEVRNVTDDIVVLVEADAESVTWTPSEDCIFDVVATNEGGKTEYDMTPLFVLTFEHQSEDLIPVNEIDSVNHIVKFSCTKGKLMIKKSAYVEEEETEAPMAVRADEGWYAANQNAKLHHEDLSQYDNGEKFTLTAKAVSLDGTKESPAVSVKVNMAEIVAGIANVSVDANSDVEYYNLQGVRVETTTPGIYLVRLGNEVSKVVIR